MSVPHTPVPSDCHSPTVAFNTSSIALDQSVDEKKINQTYRIRGKC